MKRFWISLVVLGAMASSGCGEEDQVKEPIKVGLVVPKSGALDFVGDSFDRVAVAAIEEINAKGGVNGHPLELIVRDSATDPVVAKAEIEALVAEGAVAAVGPATSGEVELAYPVALEHEFPLVSPSSTAAFLAEADDGGFMFRNVPNDNIQGIAMAYYLTQVSEPPVTRIAIVHEATGYGSGLAQSFEVAFEASGGTVTGAVMFNQNEPSADAEMASDVITGLQGLAEAPTMVMMVALEQDGLAIAKAWDESAALSDMQWFLTDGARSFGFLQTLPDSMVGMRGTAATFPTLGDSYSYLDDAYAERYDFDLGDEIYAPNVWDGFHLIAAALIAQDAAGQEFGGVGLRDALTQVSRGPGVILHAGQWRDITTTLNSGNAVDYDGAAGPNDFDENGETIGPYEVWEISEDGSGGLTFEQVLFLEARDIQDLAGDGT